MSNEQDMFFVQAGALQTFWNVVEMLWSMSSRQDKKEFLCYFNQKKLYYVMFMVTCQEDGKGMEEEDGSC